MATPEWWPVKVEAIPEQAGWGVTLGFGGRLPAVVFVRGPEPTPADIALLARLVLNQLTPPTPPPLVG
jgi:hypothetical protein